MTRRELVKTTIGALFGVSAIPAALEKPKWTPVVAPQGLTYIGGLDPSFKYSAVLNTFRLNLDGTMTLIESKNLNFKELADAPP